MNEPCCQNCENAMEMEAVLRSLRACRTQLNNLELNHVATFADISIQLLKHAVAIEEARCKAQRQKA